MKKTQNYSEEVSKLLKQGIDKKLQMHGDAGRSLQRAYDLANQHLQGNIWPHIAAYRLAHYLFRSADSDEDLKLVLHLFEEAANDPEKLLKPKANLYALVVKFRLNRATQAEFDQVVKMIRGAQSVSHRPTARNTQDTEFNQLELFSYLAGFEYDGLMGLDLFDDFYIEETSLGWKILGSDRLQPRIYAERELKSMYAESDTKHRLLCIWDQRKSVYNCSAENDLAVEISKAQSELLTAVLCKRFNPLHAPNRISQRKTRLNKDINPLYGHDLLNSEYKVNASFEVFAIAPKAVIRRHIEIFSIDQGVLN